MKKIKDFLFSIIMIIIGSMLYSFFEMWNIGEKIVDYEDYQKKFFPDGTSDVNDTLDYL